MNSLTDQDITCTNYYWGAIDQINEEYKQKIVKENDYINKCNLNIGDCVFTIECGLSEARNFEPAVRIINLADRSCISFNTTEWGAFVSYLRQLVTDFFDSDVELENMVTELDSDENIKIENTKFLDAKIVKVSSCARTPSTSFYLSESLVKEIIKLNAAIIKYRLETMNGMHFFKFYKNFLNITNRLLLQSNYELNPENVLTAFCQILSSNPENDCMRECWFYHKNKMIVDLERERL